MASNLGTAQAAVTGAVNSLQMDLTRYQNADHIVSGEEYLDEDNLNNQISTKKSIKSSLDYSIRVYQTMASTNPVMSVGEFLFNITHQLTRMSDSIQDDIYDLQKKLEKLLVFAAQTSGLFRDSLSNFKIAMQGVLVLNDTMVHGEQNFFLIRQRAQLLQSKICLSQIILMERLKAGKLLKIVQALI